jgi:hypothetical protein
LAGQAVEAEAHWLPFDFRQGGEHAEPRPEGLALRFSFGANST